MSSGAETPAENQEAKQPIDNESTFKKNDLILEKIRTIKNLPILSKGYLQGTMKIRTTEDVKEIKIYIYDESKDTQQISFTTRNDRIKSEDDKDFPNVWEKILANNEIKIKGKEARLEIIYKFYDGTKTKEPLTIEEK